MRKTLLSIAGVAAAFAVIPLAQADDTAQLRAELAEVRARMQQDQAALAQVQAQLSQFRQDQSENWLSERRAEEVKSLIHEVLSDADTRATLLQDSMTAGHDGRRFFLASADGSFRMNINGQLQFRYIYNNRNDATSGAVAGKDDTMGFQFRRSKLTFSGHIGDPGFSTASVSPVIAATAARAWKKRRFATKLPTGCPSTRVVSRLLSAVMN